MHQITIALAALCVAVVRGNSTCHGCHTPICGENEVPVRGHPRRDKFCRPVYTPREVFKQLRKCVCKPTYVRNSWNECVPRKLCRRCKCRIQKDWHMCSSACPVTYNMRVPLCGKMCVPGCDCPPGWVVDSRNWKRCVKAKKFPPICPPHSTFQPCVSNCLPRCGIIAPKTCVTSCHRGACVCDEGFAEFWGYQGRVCVRQEKCEWHLRNLLLLIRSSFHGAGAGLHGGAIGPGGFVIGPWGAILPGATGLFPVSAGINGGSAFLSTMNAAAGVSNHARGGVTPFSMTGARGSANAPNGIVGGGTRGIGLNAPARPLRASGISLSGVTANGPDGAGVILPSGPSGPNTSAGNAAVRLSGVGTPLPTVTASGSTGNSVGVPGIGVLGGNLVNMGGAVGAGLSPSGGRVPLSVSRGPTVTGNGRGTARVDFTGGSLGGTGRNDSAGISLSGTALPIAPGTSTGPVGTNFVGVHSPGVEIRHPSATGLVGSLGPNRGAGSVNAAGASSGGVSEFHGSSVRYNTGTGLLSSGAAVSGSEGRGIARAPLVSGSVSTGGRNVGINTVTAPLSNTARHGESGAGADMGGALLNSGAGVGGSPLGAIPWGAHLRGNSGVLNSAVSVNTGSSSSSGGVGARGGAFPTAGASLGGSAGAGGTRVHVANANIPSVTRGSSSNALSSRVTGVPTNSAVISTSNTRGISEATGALSNIRNGAGSAGGHSVGTGSGSAVANGNVVGSLRTGGISTVAHLAGGTVRFINGGGSAGSHAIATGSGGATGIGGVGASPTGGSGPGTRNVGGSVNVINGAGSADWHSVATGSGSAVGNSNVGAALAGGIGAITPSTGGSASGIHGSHSVTSGTIVGGVDGQPTGNAINAGRHHDVSEVSTSRITRGPVGEGENRSVAGGSLGAATRPAATVGTAIMETASTNGLIRPAISVNGSIPGGDISPSGSIVNGGGHASPHSEISSSSGNLGLRVSSGATGTEMPLSSSSVSPGGVTSGSTLDRGNISHYAILVNSGGSGGPVGAGRAHGLVLGANGAVISGATSPHSNGGLGGPSATIHIESIPNGIGTGTGVIGAGGGTVRTGPGSAPLSVVTTPSGTGAVVAPDATATSGVVGSATPRGSGGVISVGPVSIILPATTGAGGAVRGVAPVALSTTTLTSGPGAGGNGAVGPIVFVSPGGGAATGQPPEATATGGAANSAANVLISAANTGVTTGGIRSVVVHEGGTTPLGATGTESSTTGLRLPGAVEAANVGRRSAGLVGSTGGSHYSSVIYGVPPMTTLSSGRLRSTGLTNGRTVSSILTDSSNNADGGVDTGETLASTEAVRRVTPNGNITVSAH